MANSKYIIPHQHKLNRASRNLLHGHRSFVVWLTGLSGSGKSTLANLLEQALHEQGVHTYILDGDNIRTGLNQDLDFSEAGRVENIRRISEVAKLFVDAGVVVITAFISPYISDRQLARNLAGTDSFVEVFVNCPLDVCEQRDVKGLYAKARAGMIKDFTGINSPFEAPEHPEVIVYTAQETLDESLNAMLEYILPLLGL